jgi:hypothetical protein
MGAITRGIANNVLGTGEIDATDGVNGVIPASNVNNTSFGSVTALPALAGTITTVAGDPPAPSEGQVWYNSVAGALKYYGYSRAWATGGNTSTTRYARGGFGIQTAALRSGGESNAIPDYGYSTAVEEYDGSSWTAGTALPSSNSRQSGAGILTAGLMFGGASPVTPGNTTKLYDGTTWTSSGNMTTTRYDLGGNGTPTAAFAFGGADTAPPFGVRTTAESFSSGTWTSETGLNTARLSLGCAPQEPGSSGLAYGGAAPSIPGRTQATEEWNGTAWTTVNSMVSTARQDIGGAGTQTDALGFGGAIPPTRTNATEAYNGTSWSTDVALNVSRSRAVGSGSASAALAVGGYDGVSTNNASLATEEFSVSQANLTISES